jgi:UDP-N-acetylmuramoyl-tripeptide--D-alanyl-D-alanine ligase
MAHLQGVGDLEGVARAKAELAEKISSKGKVAVNGDDELLLKTVSAFRKEMITFGLGERNEVRADRIQSLGRDGVSFNLHYQDGSWTVRLSVPGLQNMFNALAAAAVSFCLDEPPEHIVEGLSGFVGVKGRFMVTSLPEHVILVDDTYNANPLSLKAALASIDSLIEESGRIIVGLGEMSELGDATVSAHQEAGRMVAELRPHFFLAMGEHAYEMVKGAVESGLPLDRTEVIETHDQMLRRIRDEMRNGDLIFLKGSREVGLEKVVEGLKSALAERTGREP